MADRPDIAGGHGCKSANPGSLPVVASPTSPNGAGGLSARLLQVSARCALLEAILDALNDAIFVTNAAGEIAFENATAKLAAVRADDSEYITTASRNISIKAPLSPVPASARGAAELAEDSAERAAVGSANNAPTQSTVTLAAPGAVLDGAKVRVVPPAGCAHDFALTVKTSVAWSNPIVRTVLDNLPLPCWCVHVSLSTVRQNFGPMRCYAETHTHRAAARSGGNSYRRFLTSIVVPPRAGRTWRRKVAPLTS